MNSCMLLSLELPKSLITPLTIVLLYSNDSSFKFSLLKSHENVISSYWFSMNNS